MMQKLAKGLIDDLLQLKVGLEKNKAFEWDKLNLVTTRYAASCESQKKLEREAGKTRANQAMAWMPTITDPSNVFNPYLQHAETTNELEKKPQVPTQDDLLHVVYIGVDPSEICHWESPPSKPLLYYFSPSQQEDSRTKAWMYACTECQVNPMHVFKDLLFSNSHSLETKDSLLIQTILKIPKQTASIATYSKALSGHNLHQLSLYRMRKCRDVAMLVSLERKLNQVWSILDKSRIDNPNSYHTHHPMRSQNVAMLGSLHIN